jgi:hypothetical protein
VHVGGASDKIALLVGAFPKIFVAIVSAAFPVIARPPSAAARPAALSPVTAPATVRVSSQRRGSSGSLPDGTDGWPSTLLLPWRRWLPHRHRKLIVGLRHQLLHSIGALVVSAPSHRSTPHLVAPHLFLRGWSVHDMSRRQGRSHNHSKLSPYALLIIRRRSIRQKLGSAVLSSPLWVELVLRFPPSRCNKLFHQVSTSLRMAYRSWHRSRRISSSSSQTVPRQTGSSMEVPCFMPRASPYSSGGGLGWRMARSPHSRRSSTSSCGAFLLMLGVSPRHSSSSG